MTAAESKILGFRDDEPQKPSLAREALKNRPPAAPAVSKKPEVAIAERFSQQFGEEFGDFAFKAVHRPGVNAYKITVPYNLKRGRLTELGFTQQEAVGIKGDKENIGFDRINTQHWQLSANIIDIENAADMDKTDLTKLVRDKMLPGVMRKFKLDEDKANHVLAPLQVHIDGDDDDNKILITGIRKEIPLDVLVEKDSAFLVTGDHGPSTITIPEKLVAQRMDIGRTGRQQTA